MNTTSLRFAFFAVGLVAVTTLVSAAAPGRVDFSEFKGAANRQSVEVNLDRGLIRIATILAEKKDAEVARLLAGIEGVSVRVFGFDASARGSTLARVEEIRSTLDRSGWQRVVNVVEGDEGDNVAIFVKLGERDVIQGVVVTVLGKSNEAVLVNVVGEVAPEQLATLGERFDIEPLRDLKLASSR